jgi:hypothetical protein
MGTVSGLKVSGYCACPTCGPELKGQYSRLLRKIVYHEHRRRLPTDHEWRLDTRCWPSEEHHPTPNGPSPEAQLAMCDLVQAKLVLRKDVGVNRRSAMWDLPYWRVSILVIYLGEHISCWMDGCWNNRCHLVCCRC